MPPPPVDLGRRVRDVLRRGVRRVPRRRPGSPHPGGVRRGHGGARSVGWPVSPSAAVFGASAVLASAGAGLASPALVRIVARNVRRRGTSPGRRRSSTAGTGPGLVAAGAPGARAAARLADGLAGQRRVRRRRRGRRAPSGPRRHGARGPRDHRPAREAVAARDLVPPARRPARAAALLLGAGSAAVWNLGRAVLVDAGPGGRPPSSRGSRLGVGGTAVAVTARWLAARPPRTAWTITVVAVALGTVGLGVGAALLPVALVACVVFGWGYTAATGALVAWTGAIDAEHAPSGTSMLFVTSCSGRPSAPRSRVRWSSRPAPP